MIAGFGLYLNSQNKLVPVLDAIVGPGTEKTSSTLGEYIIALTLILILFAFLPGNASLILASIILIEALVTNTQSGHNVVKDLGL